MKLAIVLNVIGIYLILKKLNINKKVKSCTLKLEITKNDKIRFILLLCSDILILLNIIANIKLNFKLYNIPVIKNPYTYYSIFLVELCVLTTLMIRSKLGVTQDGIIYFWKIHKWIDMDQYSITEDNVMEITLKQRIFKSQKRKIIFKVNNKEKDDMLRIIKSINNEEQYNG